MAIILSNLFRSLLGVFQSTNQDDNPALESEQPSQLNLITKKTSKNVDSSFFQKNLSGVPEGSRPTVLDVKRLSKEESDLSEIDSDHGGDINYNLKRVLSSQPGNDTRPVKRQVH